jgi:nucleoid-associated protein Lsr2
MAQKVITELVCDLTGEPAAETVEFGIGGKAFEVDLTQKHADALREILEDYVKVARPAGKLTAASNSRRSSGTRASVDREQSRAIREWARAQGISVSDRGRISEDIRRQFDAAH